MKNVSQAFRDALQDNTTQLKRRISFSLKDGRTVNITESDLWNNGFRLEQSVSSESSFDIGSAIIGKLTLEINDIENKFSGFVFDGADVVAYLGVDVGDTIEWVQMFTGTVVDAPYQNTSIIQIVCYDNLYKLDKTYVPYRAGWKSSAYDIVRYIARQCLGSYAMLGTMDFPNKDFEFVDYSDDKSPITYRQMIAWISQALGLYCYCKADGKLCLEWYDTTDSRNHAEINKKTNLTTFLDDVVITGIEVNAYAESTEEQKSYLFGNAGYVILVSQNRLITNENYDVVGRMLANKIVGMRFRPFSATMFTDPTLDVGDSVTFSDKDGNTFFSYITNIKICPSAFSNTSCGAVAPERNSAQQYSVVNQIQSNTQKQLRSFQSESENMAKLISQGLGVNYGEYTLPNGETVMATYDGNTPDTSLWISYTTSEGTLQQVRNKIDDPWGVASAVDRYGNGLYQALTARGLNADWINAGHLTADLLDGKIADTTGKARVSYWNLKTGEVYIDANKFTLFSSGSSSGQTNIGEYIDAVAKEAADAALKASDVARYIAEFQAQLDGKTESYYQEEMPGFDADGNLIWTNEQTGFLMDHLGNYIEAPTTDGQTGEDAYILTRYDSTVASHEGDLWRQPSTGKDFIFYGGRWIEQTNPVPDDVYDKIDGKAQIFTAEPIAPYNVGDLWFINDQSEILTCVQARSGIEGYDPHDWQKRNKYTDDTNAQIANQKAEKAQTDVDALDKSLDPTGVFNRLTNNGTMQGIFLEKGQLYINGSIIKANSISTSNLSADVLSASNIKAGTLNVDNVKMMSTSGGIAKFTGNDGVNDTTGIQVWASNGWSESYSNRLAVTNAGIGLFNSNAKGLYISTNGTSVVFKNVGLSIPTNASITLGDKAYFYSTGSGDINLKVSKITCNGYAGYTGVVTGLNSVWVNSSGYLEYSGHTLEFQHGILVRADFW